MSYPKHSTKFYKGIEIEISYFEGAENPFENWDCCVPLISESNYGENDYSKGDILRYLRNYLSYNQVRRHQKRILEMMGYDWQQEKNYVDGEDLTEYIQDSLLYDWLEDSMDNMGVFCKEFNIKHYQSISRGHSQSDWAEIFICWTPEFGEVTGRDYKSIDDKDFEDGFKLFSNWAWGNVFWYNIEDENEEYIGSCGGFYGDEFEENGLMEHAKEDIDSYIENKKQMKQNKLKTLIKNNVPFQKRTQILETI